MSARVLFWLHRQSLRGSVDSIVKGLLMSVRRGALPAVPPGVLRQLPPSEQEGVTVVNLQNSEGKSIPVSLRSLEFPGKTPRRGLVVSDGLIVPVDSQDWETGAKHAGTLTVEHPFTQTKTVHVFFPRESLQKLGATFRGHIAYLRVSNTLWEELQRHRRVGDFAHAFANLAGYYAGEVSQEKLKARTGLEGIDHFLRRYAPGRENREFVLELLTRNRAKDIAPLLRKHFGVSGAGVERAANTLAFHVNRLYERDVLESFAFPFGERR